MDFDAIMQKYLTGHATQEEKDWLLEKLAKGYNGILIRLHQFKKGEN